MRRRHSAQIATAQLPFQRSQFQHGAHVKRRALEPPHVLQTIAGIHCARSQAYVPFRRLFADLLGQVIVGTVGHPSSWSMRDEPSHGMVCPTLGPAPTTTFGALVLPPPAKARPDHVRLRPRLDKPVEINRIRIDARAPRPSVHSHDGRGTPLPPASLRCSINTWLPAPGRSHARAPALPRQNHRRHRRSDSVRAATNA